jgi:hypothetical protein
MMATEMQPARDPRRPRGRRLRALGVGLLLLTAAYLVVGMPDLFRRDAWFPRPLDPCLTERAVKDHLHTRVVLVPEPSGRFRPIILDTNRISDLSIRPGNPPSIRVRFVLDQGGERLPVEGSFPFTSSDSPGLHYHTWGDFEGWVVPRR